jgi:hypothetical protein
LSDVPVPDSPKVSLKNNGVETVPSGEATELVGKSTDNPEAARVARKKIAESSMAPPERAKEEFLKYGVSRRIDFNTIMDDNAKQVKKALQKDLFDDFNKSGMPMKNADAKDMDAILRKIMKDVYGDVERWTVGELDKKYWEIERNIGKTLVQY